MMFGTIRTLWKRGILWPEGDESDVYEWEAKVYERPSFWGVNNSRISKLYIYKGDQQLYCYERGWYSDLPPDWMIDDLIELFPGVLDDEA